MEKVKSLLPHIKYKLTKTRIILLCAVAAVSLSCFALLGKGKDNQTGGMIVPKGTRTTVLQSGTISDSVTVTGTVQSTDTVNVTTTVSNTKVSEILVQVGDSVQKGDTIIKLDTGTILEKIEEVKEKLSISAKKAQENYTAAQDALEKAKTDARYAEDALYIAQSARDTAKTNFNLAVNAVANERSKYSRALSALTSAENDFNKARAEWKALSDEYTLAQENLTNAERVLAEAENALANSFREERETASENRDNALAAYNSAREVYDFVSAQYGDTASQSSIYQKYINAQTEYETAKTEESAAASALESAKTATNYNRLETDYKSAETAYENARKNLDTLEDAYTKAEDAFDTAKENLENANTSDELEELYEQYSRCIIKAETSGTITRINTSVGSVANGTLAVIQDTYNLKISTSFRESDVQNIKIGMKCVITSDANDEKLSGYVSQISPTAATGNMASSDVSFSAEITIDGTDHGLLIGMNAKARVILSQKDNVFVVPYDAVGENENGEKVVYVQKGDDFEPVVVTTGMETDYYIEISSQELSEGMVIRSFADESASESAVFSKSDETEQSGGGFNINMGGMPGGNMPEGSTRPGGRG